MKFTAACHCTEAILYGTYLQDTPITNSTTANTRSLTTVLPKFAHYSNHDTQDNNPHEPLHLQQEETPPLVQLLLDSLQYASSPDAITPDLTEAEYKAKIRAWDEATSTSPTSNMHIGHLKAYWMDHTLSTLSKEADDLKNTHQKNLAGHLTLLNYALQYGSLYHAWTHVINTMLEKDQGGPKIHRL